MSSKFATLYALDKDGGIVATRQHLVPVNISTEDTVVAMVSGLSHSEHVDARFFTYHEIELQPKPARNIGGIALEVCVAEKHKSCHGALPNFGNPISIRKWEKALREQDWPEETSKGEAGGDDDPYSFNNLMEFLKTLKAK